MSFLRQLLLALQFFTRIPLTGRLAQWVGYSAELQRASVAHFPAVGWLVGAVAALVYALVALVLPDVPAMPWVAAVASTVGTVLLTGAFHEDGLADVADGLGVARTPEATLLIMKDSHVGAFGVLALVLALLGKVGLLALLGSVDVELTCVGLLAAHVVSRLLPLGLIRLLPYVGDVTRSKSLSVAAQITTASLLVALGWTLLLLVPLFFVYPDVDWLRPLVVTLLAWVWMWRLFARRLHGFTGDTLGATQQVCEIAYYFGLALAL